jgi:hypothetical protein
MDFNSLKGLTITEIAGMRRGSEEILFTTSDGRRFRMHHHQDCCESVSVEDVCGDVEDLIGAPITRAEERSSGVQARDYGDEQWTFYELATNKGSMTLRWYGTSNGYYGTGVSFEELDHHDLAREGRLEDGVYEVETRDGREWWLWDGERWRDFSGDTLDTWQGRNRFTVLGPALRRPS